MLSAMARSAMHFLKKRGLTDVAIAAQVGCERRTVARVMRQPVDHAYRRRPSNRLAHWDAAVITWLDADLPIKRMLELARSDATTPYTGSPATWYRYVHRHQQARAADAAPVIRFEGLPGEFLQIDWGEANVPLGTAVVRRVFLAARLKPRWTPQNRVRHGPVHARRPRPDRSRRCRSTEDPSPPACTCTPP
jgi:hypothetical protein